MAWGCEGYISPLSWNRPFFSSQHGVRLRRQFFNFELKLTLFFFATWSKVAKVIPHLWVKSSPLFLCNLTWEYTTPLRRNRHFFLCNLAWGNIMPLSWNKTYFSFSTWHEDILHLKVETDLLFTMSLSLCMDAVNMLRLICGGGVMPKYLSCDWSARFMKVVLLGLSSVRTTGVQRLNYSINVHQYNWSKHIFLILIYFRTITYNSDNRVNMKHKQT